MKPTLDSVYAEALRLSPDEREALRSRLAQEFQTPGKNGHNGFASAEIEQSWIEEAEHRIDAVERGEMEEIDGEEILRALREGRCP